ncbi:hypothetical protein PCASD_15548 [Puccinia coronata f. sp. avenae]|uniref:Uncharacterized protein n=1 Tax=Puccinia coronata f. sp. avenae TaxID=200324 RepID=A0A2N5U6L1_9BASI|nr:hypothetical protein PCASD_15548 [Puccinia coronata f. sp. avenae]
MPGDNDCLVKLALRANHNHFVAQLITQPLTPSKRIYLGHGHLLGINCPLAQGNLLLLKTVYRISLNYFCKLATATIAVSNHTNWVPRSHYKAIRLPIQADCAVLLSSIPAVRFQSNAAIQHLPVIWTHLPSCFQLLSPGSMIQEEAIPGRHQDSPITLILTYTLWELMFS